MRITCDPYYDDLGPMDLKTLSNSYMQLKQHLNELDKAIEDVMITIGLHMERLDARITRIEVHLNLEDRVLII